MPTRRRPRRTSETVARGCVTAVVAADRATVLRSSAYLRGTSFPLATTTATRRRASTPPPSRPPQRRPWRRGCDAGGGRSCPAVPRRRRCSGSRRRCRRCDCWPPSSSRRAAWAGMRRTAGKRTWRCSTAAAAAAETGVRPTREPRPPRATWNLSPPPRSSRRLWRTSSRRRTRTSVAAGARNEALIASRLSSNDNFGYALRI